ncbi:hypothetical protein EVAR_74078_1 [Eumeta japonica]|uniref:ZAD domain-containing protein n=1 Tax=Eumeta variegata TaxID=151549 RepID=A0A4C1SZV3_EUMVA|nr:hypothetical protein EVAR_74078_1 [Eumeta japonica]
MYIYFLNRSVSLNPTGLCISCWSALSTFHKFYARIKEAHEFLASSRIKVLNDHGNISNDHCHELNLSTDCKDEISEPNPETEILIEEPILSNVADFENPLIKAETEYAENDSITRRKRGRPAKNTESRSTQREKIPFKRKPDSEIKKLNRTLKSLQSTTEEKIKAKDALESGNESISALDVNDNCSDTDYETNEEKVVQKPVRKTKKS